MPFATVVVTDTAGVSVARGKTSVLGAEVTQALNSDLAPGDYRIAYRVVSKDGHSVSGESRFTLMLASSASRTPSAEASTAWPAIPITATPSAASPSDVQEGRLIRIPVLIAGTAGLVVAGAVVLRRTRKRR